jgi:uncharacterized protein with HEPN domain
MPHPDHSWLADIFIAARKIERITSGLDRPAFEADETKSLSVERLLEIMGEATKQVSKEFRAAHPELPWRRMAGMRDILIHSYRIVDPAIVWIAATEVVPEIIRVLAPLVKIKGSERFGEAGRGDT